MTTEEYKDAANFWKDKQCKEMPAPHAPVMHRPCRDGCAVL